MGFFSTIALAHNTRGDTNTYICVRAPALQFVALGGCAFPGFPITPASPQHIPPWLVCSVPAPHSPAMAGGNQMDLGGGGGWGQGFEGYIFLMGLGREVSEPEQFSRIAVALTVSTKKIGLGRGSGLGEGQWVHQTGPCPGLQGQRAGGTAPAHSSLQEAHEVGEDVYM